VNNRQPKIEKEAKANPKLRPTVELLNKIIVQLDSGSPLWKKTDLLAEYREELSDLQLMTAKPILYLFNLDDNQLNDKEKQAELEALVAPAPVVFVSAKLEDELRGLDEPDRIEMLKSYGQDEQGLNQVIHAAYDLLGLQSYLTAGEKEVRAWTIHKGDTAPQAAGVIHTDFEKGFIAAQIVNYNDLVEAGSELAAKAAGKMRTEGKTYVMKEGDVVEFRFNN
jgi:GTP-binding protein YchF